VSGIAGLAGPPSPSRTSWPRCRRRPWRWIQELLVLTTEHTLVLGPRHVGEEASLVRSDGEKGQRRQEENRVHIAEGADIHVATVQVPPATAWRRFLGPVAERGVKECVMVNAADASLPERARKELIALP